MSVLALRIAIARVKVGGNRYSITVHLNNNTSYALCNLRVSFIHTAIKYMSDLKVNGNPVAMDPLSGTIIIQSVQKKGDYGSCATITFTVARYAYFVPGTLTAISHSNRCDNNQGDYSISWPKVI